VENLHLPVRCDLDVRWFEISMNDALLVSGFEGLRDLCGDRQCEIEWNRSLLDSIRQRWPFHEFEHQGPNAIGFLQSVDRSDVRMIQRGEELGFRLESRETVRIAGEDLG